MLARDQPGTVPKRQCQLFRVGDGGGVVAVVMEDHELQQNRLNFTALQRVSPCTSTTGGHVHAWQGIILYQSRLVLMFQFFFLVAALVDF